MFKNLKKAFTKAQPALTTAAAAALPLAANAADMAAGAKQNVKDTFGVGSTAWMILLVLEILAAVYSYIRTKNLAVFGGIIAVILFGNIAWSLIGN